MYIKFRVSILILFTSFMFTGCYTVVWHPNEELPNNENSVKKETVFYDVNNFGVFNPYYNSPWWLNPDNDFLLTNLNAVTDLVIIREDINLSTLEPTGGCPVVPPHKIRPIVSPMGKPINLSFTKKPSKRNKNSNIRKIRNNNGNRKTTKGRSRWDS